MRAPSRQAGARARGSRVWLTGWLLVAACTGSIDTGGGASPGNGPGAGSNGNKAGNGGVAGKGGATAMAGAGAVPSGDFTSSPGLRRLTRAEYTNSVFDLVGVDLSADDRPKELVVRGHSEIAGAQKIGYDDNNTFVDLGDKAAVAAATKLDAQITCTDNACLRTWASDFLLRAFRAPPAAAVLDRYAAMLSAPEAGATRVERVTTFLTAVLTSPHFLYRKETGTAAVAGDASLRTLDAYQVATRLSYLVWQSTPDTTLLAAAKSASLMDPTARLAELDRLLKDKRAQPGLRSFVSDWMGLFDNNLAKKAPAVLADAGADFPQVAQRGFDLLVDDVLAANTTARFSDLLKVDYAYVNTALGKVLGVTGGADFQKVTLKAGERAGLLTQPMVIGAHSKESGASPFPIGKFIYENILCEEIPPPPQSFPPVDDSASGQTLRQKLEAMTKNEPCITCHKRIGPPGFSFLPYDPIGRYRNADAKGQPYDTTGALLLADTATPMPFTSAADLSTKLAAVPSTQRCIARRAFRWAYGRFEGDADATVLGALEKSSIDSNAGVLALLRQIVSAPSFTQVRIR